jgi:hypothetical protein
MADRCFPNTMRDYADLKRSRDAPEQSLPEPDVLLKAAMALKEQVGCPSLPSCSMTCMALVFVE